MHLLSVIDARYFTREVFPDEVGPSRRTGRLKVIALRRS